MQLTEAARKKRRRAYAKHVEMDVKGIRWTQVSINNRFGNSLPIEWTIAKLRSGEIIPRELPLIRVAKFKGKYRSVDNRRLFCYKTAGIKRIPVVVIKEDRKMKQLFEKNKSKNNGTNVRIVEIAVNPKNLDTKVITYDPTGGRPAKFWTVRQAIQELDQEAFPVEKPEEPTPEPQEPVEAQPEPEVEAKAEEPSETPIAAPAQECEMKQPQEPLDAEPVVVPDILASPETTPKGEQEGEEGILDETIVLSGSNEGVFPVVSPSTSETQQEGSDDTGTDEK
jgi:hypothetical protein